MTETEEDEAARCRQWVAAIVSSRDDCRDVLMTTAEMLWNLLADKRAEAFEAGRLHGYKQSEERRAESVCEVEAQRRCIELAACKAKLARAEATLMSDWCKAAGYVHRADDFGRLHAELRAVLVEKP